jgi:hypothetical protein
MGQSAPYLPFIVPVEIDSVSGKLSFVSPPLIGRGVPNLKIGACFALARPQPRDIARRARAALSRDGRLLLAGTSPLVLDSKEEDLAVRKRTGGLSLTPPHLAARGSARRRTAYLG